MVKFKRCNCSSLFWLNQTAPKIWHAVLGSTSPNILNVAQMSGNQKLAIRKYRWFEVCMDCLSLKAIFANYEWLRKEEIV